MKFILFFCFLSICFSQVTDKLCETKFLSILQAKCQSLGSCTLNTNDLKCLPTSSCTEKSSGDCSKTIPNDFHNKKCVYNDANGSCDEVDKVCSDYNKAVNGNVISGDICSSLTKETNKGDRCYFSYPSGGTLRTCTTHYNSCDSINELSDKSETKCTPNIPSDLTKKCVWNNNQCSESARKCTEYNRLYEWANKTNCNSLKASEGSSCVYYQNSCIEAYPCSHWDNDQTNCNGKTPLNDDLNDYDYLYKCKYDTSSNKCEKVNKTCADYNDNTLIKGDALCSEFVAEDSINKNCKFDEIYEECIEQYKTCQIYDEKVSEKSRDKCEGIILYNSNKKCMFIEVEKKCFEGNVYNNCDEYKGSDRKICENILSSKSHSYCSLDKDSVCKEKDIPCAEAIDKYNCLVFAKPTDDTKKCIWESDQISGVCKEQYKGCENFVEKRNDSQSICDALEVYNGKRCYYDSDKCKSKEKKCAQAMNEEECKLIEKTGVSDPERKYCEWYSTDSTCRENYKYCSDYKSSTGLGNTKKIACENIKPFNPKTETLDLAYKCTIKDTKVGCEKVAKECSDAEDNKILCDLISPIINENNIKYCAFIQGSCNEYYKTCELVDETKLVSSNTKCTSNIPEGHYFPGICQSYSDNGKTKCRTISPLNCGLLNTNINYYRDLCVGINPYCSYTSGGKCTTTTNLKICKQIQFYTSSYKNKDICEAISVGNDYRICVLKEDKSGCEEVYRKPLPIVYAKIDEPIEEPEDSGFKFKINKNHIIIILLILLFSLIMYLYCY